MEKQKKKQKTHVGLWVVVLFVMLLAGAAAVWKIYQKNDIVKSEKAQLVMEALEDEEVEALFISMYPIGSYDVEDFLTYRGFHTISFSEPLESGKILLKFLEQSLEEEHSLQAVYIGITQQEKETGWEEKLLEVIRQNSEIRFHLIIEYPYIGEFAKLSQEEQEKLFAWYEKMAELFTPTKECQNMIVYLPEAETWLSGNPANYEENGTPNKEVAKYVLGQIICIDSYALNLENVDTKLLTIKRLLAENEKIKELDPEYTFVFFGDSVIGNFTDSMSIPGVVSGVGQVRTVNCGYGGLAASKMSEESYGIIDMTDALLEGQYEEFGEDKAIRTGITKFYEILPEIKQDKLVFFLSLGINDYLSGNPLEAFEQGVKDAVNRLREGYPQSEIVLMTPSFIAYGEGGTEKINGYSMEQLAESVMLLSEELDTKYIDIYHETGFNMKNHETYISDMVHPNVLGRYEIGNIICQHLAQWYPK